MKRWTIGRIARWAGAVLAIVFIAFYGAFGSLLFCTQCGRERHTTDWQVPFTELTYFRTRSTRETPLSTVVDRHGLRGKHEHTWLYAHGGGNGVLCAIGEGRHLATAIYSPEVAAFLDAEARYRGQADAQKWLKLLLDPAKTWSASDAVRAADVPAGGFPDQARFESWWKKHREEISLMLGEEPAEQAAPAGETPLQQNQGDMTRVENP